MLRSTGFFRGIDCPFFKEYHDEDLDAGDVKHDGCKRPYCHFRHSSSSQQQHRHRTALLGATKHHRDLQSKHKEQGYDPYNPEVTRHEGQQNGDSSASGDFSGALELVKQQIEAVRTQVEREKRKLSRIGDDEYEPSASAGAPAETLQKRPSPAAVTAHLAYDPGSYQMSTVDYNPTPGCSKYTLDSDGLGNHANSMEYVPTSVKKPAAQTYAPQLPSPHAPKYSNHKSSSKCKYTLDNSKPSTDMEYDPLSNYSATIAGKPKRDEAARAAKVGAGKAHKPPGSGRLSTDEEYVPTAKKPRQQKEEGAQAAKVDAGKVHKGSGRVSTDDEYVPTTVKKPRQQKEESAQAAKEEAGKAHKASESRRLSTDDEYVPTTVKKPRQQKEESAQAAKEEAGKAHKASESRRLSTDDEYVPTPVRKPRQQKDESALTGKAEAGKAHKASGSGRLSTDDEYVPTAVKKPRQQSAQAAKTEAGKAVKMSGSGRLSTDDEYVPTSKKPPQQSVDTQKYTFSDSEEESSGTEYRPISLSSLQRKKGSGGSVEDAVGAGRKEATGGAPCTQTQRSKEEPRVTEEWDSWDDGLQNDKEKTENDKAVSKSTYKKSSKCEKAAKVEKDLGKTSSGSHTGNHGSASNSKDKVSSKTLLSSKKDGNSQGKKDDGKSKVKSNNKVLVEGREQKRNDGKVKSAERVKGDLCQREKDTENGGGESKKPKSLDKEKDRSRQKDHHHNNGKLDSSRREKDTKKSSKSVSSSSTKGMSNSSSRNIKGSSLSIKDKAKKSSSSSDGNLSVKKKRRVASLSHADLFGDESPDEMEPAEEDEDEDDKEVVVRTLNSTLKKGGGLNKRKASEITVSSSEDEGDCGAEEDIDYGEVDFSSLQADVDFDSDPMEECLRIFNESKDVKNQDKGRQAKQPSRDSEDEEGIESTLTTLVPGQKKRVSHFAVQGNTEAAPKSAVRPYKRPSAQEMCYQRMQIAQQQAAQLAAAVKRAPASPSPSPGCSGERKRIAHRPNPLSGSSTKHDAKPASSRVLTPSTNLTAHLSVKTHTFSGIMSKTSSTVAQKRVAHTPTMKSSSMKRPVIPTEFGAKVPTNVRQRYLNTFIDECVKFCPSEDAAFQMALDEEKIVYDRSNSKNIYLNVAVNTLKKLRGKSNSAASPVHKAPAYPGNRKAQSHEEVLGGRLAAKTSFTINRMGKQQEEKLTEVVLYRKLKDYLMTEEQLQEHGYPRSNPDAAGRAVIHNLPEKKAPADPFTKICCRCGTEYRINANGNCVRKEECSHHWGRLRRHKVSGGWETNYSCCSGAVGTPGCEVAKQHMQDGRKESLDGYVTTFSKQLPPDGNGGVYALDCEMCYTKQGLDLTRVTVINSELKVIYDTFVKPDSQVVDYNTRFSGVTEEDLESATITLRDVQAVLLSMFSAESILVGHSLESDLLALKLIHSMVVDTSIVFPHRLGLPYKRALRNLMADHLKRIIQDNVDGHDSSEDAAACMELMVWKLKEDAKVKR